MIPRYVTNGFFTFDEIESKTQSLPIRISTYSHDFEQKFWRYKYGSERNHLYYIKEGRGAVDASGTKINFSAGSFLFFRSKVPITFLPVGKSYKVKYFTFAGSAAEALLDYYSIPECIVLKSETLKNSFDKIFSYIDNRVDLERISAKLYSFVVDLGIAYNASNEKSGFEKALSYIDNHYYHNISIQSISEFTGSSESALYKQFKKKLNTSPGAYINSLRINRAKYYLLSEPELSSEHIGYMVGFNSPSYFIECFKNTEGITPHQFRNLKSKDTDEQ